MYLNDKKPIVLAKERGYLGNESKKEKEDRTGAVYGSIPIDPDFSAIVPSRLLNKLSNRKKTVCEMSREIQP